MKKLFLLTTLMLILLPAFLCTAQITKKQAIAVVLDSIVRDKADSVNVYMETDVQTSSYYVLSPYDSIGAKFQSYWLFFIDLKPLYGWAHPCEYVFINSDNGDTTIVSKRLPPVNWATIENISVPLPLTVNPPNFDDQSTHLPYPSPNHSLFALMFTGGELGTGDAAFWNAMSHMYCGLREHGFAKENIYVLSHNGSARSNPNNPSMDLDHDGSADILSETCTVPHLDDIIGQLQNKMTYGDMLYVFVATHGDTCLTDTSRAYFLLYNQDTLSNYHFAQHLQSIHCAQMILNLWSCYSGRFTYKLNQMNNSAKKTILTCVGKDYVPRDNPNLNQTGMDLYNYLSCTALRGWHPDVLDVLHRHPWAVTYRVGNMPQNIFDNIITTPPNAADTNFDSIPYGGNYNGIQEINEVMNYTKAYDGGFKDYGSKIYNCGFHKGNSSQPPEDLLSLYGITGKVQYTQAVEGNFLIGGKLSIEPGVELTLDDSVTFYVFDSAIVVKTDSLRYGSAGKLVMRGAKITSCQDTALWQGIEVWGQDSIPQVYPYQAMVLMDSSTIESAKIGISTSHKNGGVLVPHTEGGIILARTSTFNNNKVAIEYLPDTNYSTQSQILQTTFETTTATLLDGSDPDAFVRISGVTGVGVIFRGCTFIPSIFSLSPEETSLFQAYLTYFGVMNSLAGQGKSITEMSQSQLATMQSLMENGSDPVQSLSRNVLIANNLYSYTEPIILPDQTKSAKQKTPIKTGKITTVSYMKLFPNPANEFIIVEYNLKDKFTIGQVGEISVTSFQGQKLIKEMITKQQDEVLINTSTLSVGTYLCTLKLSGKVIETQRFIVVR